MEGVGMGQGSGEAVGWFDGLPLWAWVLITIGAFVVVALVAWTSRIPTEDLKVRGWEERDKQTMSEDDWWMREYPLADEIEWENGHG